MSMSKLTARLKTARRGRVDREPRPRRTLPHPVRMLAHRVFRIRFSHHRSVDNRVQHGNIKVYRFRFWDF